MIKNIDFQKIDGIEVVMIYGSLARNETDENSDIDIFVLVKDSLEEESKQEIIHKISSSCKEKEINVSLYTVKIFDQMLSDGSLFLWHLKTEGKYIYSSINTDIFLRLNSFNGYVKNFNLYKILFQRIKKSFLKNGVNSYDLSMLFFICRNISILICFKINKPNFGRHSSYRTVIDYLNYEPLKYSDFIYLSNWRMDYTRGIKEDLIYPKNDEVLMIIEQIDILFNECEAILYDQS